MAQPTKKLKILLLNPSLGLGGTEKIIVNFFKFLNKHHVKIVVFNKKNSFFDIFVEKKNIISLNVSRARYSFINLWKVLKNEKPNVIFSNQREMNIVICFLNFFLNLKATIVIREAAAINIKVRRSLGNKLYLCLLKFFYKSCDGIIFNSEYTKKSFTDKGFFFKKYNIINNPLLINNKNFYLKRRPKNFFFITCSRLDDQKNLFQLLKIFNKYSIRNKNCHLMIVGDGPLFYKIKNEIEKIKYQNKIVLIGKTHNLEKYFQKANYYISCSKSEGFGNSYIEALAFNLPIISLNSGGIRDVIKKNLQGHIVNNDNYLNFIAAINMIKKKRGNVLFPGIRRFDKNLIFNKYLNYILSCKK